MQSACAILYCHMWPVGLSQIFPHYLINGTIVGKKLLNKECRFIFSKTFSATFLIQIIIQWYIIINVDFKRRWNLLNIRVHIIDDYELLNVNKLLIWINLQVEKPDVYKTNSMEQSPSWEANRSAASQEIPRIYIEPRDSLLHLPEPVTCPYPDPDQSSPCPPPSHFLKNHLNMILPLSLDLPIGLFPSGFPTKTLYAPLLPHTCYIPRPSHSLFDRPNDI
jgi:hypothetical protein